MGEDGNDLQENSESLAESTEENNFLKRILSEEEYGLLTPIIVDKIETSIQQSFEEFLTNKALYETHKSQHEEQVNKLTSEINEKEQTLEAVSKKLDAANTEIHDIQEKLQNAQSCIEKLQEKNKQLECEWKDFKIQRDQAVDERESLLQMVERRSSELASLKLDLNDMTKQLQAAIKAKMVALENSQEVESLKISLSYKEKRLEQESTLLKSQVQSLTEEVNKHMTELTNLKRENSTKSVSIAAEMSEKMQQLKLAQETIVDLREANQKLSQKAESLLEKLAEQRNSNDEMFDNFQKELQAQTKLTQLYKGLCEENDTKTEKLTNAINELQRLLKTASDEYGELESKQKATILQHEEEIAQKDECVRLLKKELEDANELLKQAKEENLETAISTLSPCAAAASRLIKSGMSLTQIYTQYATVSEQLLLEKEENRKLSLYVNTILNEIEEKAPILKQQRIDYENALANVETLTKQMDDLVAESKLIQEEYAEEKKCGGFLKRENERLKKEVVDLSRQVCYLIKSVEEARGNYIGELNSPRISYDGTESSAQHIISKKLVTFSSIQDLQENNQKLLALVRQLSAKQEAAENVSFSEFNDLKLKEENLQARVNELMDDMERQSKMLELVRNQSITYKKLYDQSMRGEVSQDAKSLGSPAKPAGVVTSTPKKSDHDKDFNQLQELKSKLEESEKDRKNLECERDKYKAEANKIENRLTDEIQFLKKETNSLIYKNSKLVAQAEYYEEKFKVMETNIKSCKKQIQALEERNQMLGEISAKHEQSTLHLRNEVIQLQSNLSKAEVALENLREENFLLKTAEARLLKEKECWNREKHSNLLLMSNLEAIKATFERSEEEGKLRFEAQLSDALKECSALKSALKDEKSKFKELASSLERQTAVAKERMLEEKKLAEDARAELDTVRQELEAKNKQIDGLILEIREINNLPTKNVIESAAMNLDESTKRNKELERKVGDLEHEISSLKLQLMAAKQHSSQYCEMAESLEKQLNEANDNHENFRGLMTAKIEELTRKENEWKKKFEEIEEKYQMISNNQKNSTEELNAKLASSSTELKTTNTELINLKNELSSTEMELKKTKEMANSLQKALQETEAKYSNEVVLHSADIQSLCSVKKELSETVQEIANLKRERDDAVETLKLKSSSWEETEKKSVEELKLLNQRLVDLDEQNQVLHEKIQELGNQVAILQCRLADDGQKPIEECPSLNESSTLSSQAQDQLLKVIKFLRQEKEISFTKSEVLQAENVRLKTQLAITTKQLEETKEILKKSEESSGVTSKASVKHTELLRKIDTLNALTDSNRILREERDKLQIDIKKLKEQLEKAEGKLAPLSTEVKKYADKVETLTTENQALVIDLAKWKQRAERTTRGTPEDWRRLTNERENLAKQWQLEKNNNEKLEEELRKVKQEKVSLNEQLVQIQKTLQNETNEIRRLTEESNSFKQQFIKTSEVLNTTKHQLNKMMEESTKLSKEMEAKEAVIKDFKTKEERLKKLCSKYKKQYELLLKSSEEEKAAKDEELKKAKDEVASLPSNIQEDEKEKIREEGRAEMKIELTSRMTEMETRFSEKIKELEANVSSAQEESENLKKDNENLKTSINEKEERVKTVMKNARTKIAQLAEQKKNLESELEQIKGQTEMNRDENDSKFNNLKAHYESKISEMEKERSGQVAERQQERDRLNNQIKILNQKISQMQRLFDKQGAKPSTSSRPPDKTQMEPPTANIKPMAGSSSSPRKEKQIAGPVGPCWRSVSETPFASIRPTISMQARTLAVLPTSQTNNNQTSSSQSTPVIGVLPQQQVVHTTGSSAEAMSSSPTSSHTDYMPATSSATPTRQVVVAPPLSVGPPSGSDAQSTQEMEAEANENEIQQQSSSQQSQSLVQQQQMQTVAMVMPRVEQQSTTVATTQSNQQQSIDQSCGIAYSQANSSNTVTTTQAGLKRTRDVEGDSSTGLEGEDLSKVVPQGKRLRVSVSGNQAEVFHHQVTHSEGIEVEYQVPTSSQRDQEDDNLIMIDSDEEGNADEGDVEGGDDEHEFEEDNGGYEVGSYSRDEQEVGLAPYDEGPDIDEENVTDQDNNEVEVVDGSNEVPNQSGSSRGELAADGNASQSFSNGAVPVASSIESATQDQTLQQSSEATSSETINNESGTNVVVVSHAASSLSSQTFRSRNVPLLTRQQQSQLILPQSYEESGDDSIVPSTPTLFIPRRTDGFGEAVSSPQVPHQGRFTFSDPSAPITRGILPTTGEGSEDSIHLEDAGTGRSVPTTPLQVSPQELPPGEIVSEVGQSSSSAVHIEGEESDVALNIPDIVVTIPEDDDHCETPPPELSESAGEDEEEPTEKEDTSGDEPEVINLEEENDGVTSEGEKALSGLGEIEEGREAEASEPFETTNIRKQSLRMGGVVRRSMRMVYPRRSQPRRPTPIIWNEPGSSSGSTIGSAIPSVLRGGIPSERIPTPDQPRAAFRGRMQRARKWR